MNYCTDVLWTVFEGGKQEMMCVCRKGKEKQVSYQFCLFWLEDHICPFFLSFFFDKWMMQCLSCLTVCWYLSAQGTCIIKEIHYRVFHVQKFSKVHKVGEGSWNFCLIPHVFLSQKRMNCLDAPSAEDRCYTFPSLDCTYSEEGASSKHSRCMVLCNMETWTCVNTFILWSLVSREKTPVYLASWIWYDLESVQCDQRSCYDTQNTKSEVWFNFVVIFSFHLTKYCECTQFQYQVSKLLELWLPKCSIMLLRNLLKTFTEPTVDK